MPLPTSRDLTFAAGDEVPSATLNNIQDGIISHESILRSIYGGIAYDTMYKPLSTIAGDITDADVRPSGRAGTIRVTSPGAGPTVKLRGGFWLANYGDTQYEFYSYRAEDDEITVDMDAGPGPALWRRDIISIKLEVVSGVIQLDTEYTTGIFGAGENDVTDPATPAGYTKILSILIGGTGTIDIETADVIDYRVPLGGQTRMVPATSAILGGSEPWALDDTNAPAAKLIKDSSGQMTTLFQFSQYGCGFKNARLMEIGFHGNYVMNPLVTGSISLVQRRWEDDGYDTYPISSIAGLHAGDYTDEFTSIVSSGGVSQKLLRVSLANNPLWLDGTRSGQNTPMIPNPLFALAFQFQFPDAYGWELNQIYFMVAGAFETDI